jgi:hypothetical protein
MKPTRSVIDLIKDIVPETVGNENVIFIPAESKISSYWIMQHIKSGLIYNGTLGLEFAYSSVPVVFRGVPTYGEYCGLLLPKTKEEYFTFIDNPEVVKVHNEFNRSQLILFLYMYFFQFELCLPFFNEDNWAEFDFEKAINCLKNENKLLSFVTQEIFKDNFKLSQWRAIN